MSALTTSREGAAVPMHRGLRALLHHPAVTLTVAAEDGILAYGLLNLLRAIPELFEGVARAEEVGRR